METTIIDSDITVFYVTAESFPDGILAAHQKLHALIPFSEKRRYFGVSRPENGTIVYHAAAEEMQAEEGRQFNCDSLVLKKGRYTSETINDFMKDIPAIGRTFQQLRSQPGIDPHGYCVEWYIKGKDVKCMVRLAE